MLQDRPLSASLPPETAPCVQWRHCTTSEPQTAWNGPLFQLRSGAVLTRHRLNHLIQDLTARSRSCYSSHTFRIGATFAAAAAGIPDQKQGRRYRGGRRGLGPLTFKGRGAEPPPLSQKRTEPHPRYYQFAIYSYSP